MMQFQASAKTAQSVNQAFEDLSRVLMKKRDEEAEKNTKPVNTFGTSLGKPKKIDKKKKGFQDECCK